MRRRRQKNPLLMRIVAASILIHIIALPVLAHYGAFKKLQQGFRQPIQTELVKLPPPEKVREEAKKQQRVVRHTPTAHRSNTNLARAHQPAQHPINAPHVEVASGSGSGGDAGGDIENGTGKAGVLPTESNVGKVGKSDNPAPVTQPQPAPVPQPAPATRTAAATTPELAPAPEPKPKPHVPVFTDAAPLPDSSPLPAIPDDLRSEALDRTCVAEFDVGADGAPSGVRIAQSSGNDELDRLALDAAKKWHFRPATRDGQPIQSTVRLHIEFQVS